MKNLIELKVRDRGDYDIQVLQFLNTCRTKCQGIGLTSLKTLCLNSQKSSLKNMKYVAYHHSHFTRVEYLKAISMDRELTFTQNQVTYSRVFSGRTRGTAAAYAFSEMA
jgi:hypothetical protein